MQIYLQKKSRRCVKRCDSIVHNLRLFNLLSCYCVRLISTKDEQLAIFEDLTALCNKEENLSHNG